MELGEDDDVINDVVGAVAAVDRWHPVARGGRGPGTTAVALLRGPTTPSGAPRGGGAAGPSSLAVSAGVHHPQHDMQWREGDQQQQGPGVEATAAAAEAVEVVHLHADDVAGLLAQLRRLLARAGGAAADAPVATGGATTRDGDHQGWRLSQCRWCLSL